MRKLRQEGITVIYISHRIAEVMEISDQITILRDGSLHRDRKAFGSELRGGDSSHGRQGGRPSLSQKESDTSGGKPLLELEGLGKKNFLRDISLVLRGGEILGIYGLQGSGVEKLSQILYGLDAGDTGRAAFYLG